MCVGWTGWLPPQAAASRDSLERCAAIQAEALAKGPPPDVLLASSWGAAVALKLLADRAWTGPALLLCPGHRKLLGADDAEALVDAVAALPRKTLRHVKLLHGAADAVVPIADSRELARRARVPLVELPGGTHGLGAATADGTVAREALSVLAARHERTGAALGGMFFLDGVPRGRDV